MFIYILLMFIILFNSIFYIYVLKKIKDLETYTEDKLITELINQFNNLKGSKP